MSDLSLLKSEKAVNNLPQGFTLTCHAGAMNTKANSVKSIEQLIEFGAQVVEMDVTFRPDGTAVIIHSSSPSSDEGELLEDALKAVAQSDSCKINLDLKAYSNLPEVDRLVKKHGLFDRVFYTGVEEAQTKTVRESSSIPYYLNCSPFSLSNEGDFGTDSYAEKIIALGAIGMNVNFRFVKKKTVKTMHEHSLPVSVWTVDCKRDARRMLSYGVDNITTKRPDKLLQLIEAE